MTHIKVQEGTLGTACATSEGDERKMSASIVMVDVDDLGIDTVNIRGGEWDGDAELIQSIRDNGIIDPLIVRSAKPSTGVKYAIVCGSRRYNAAIEVGLTEVPVIIREMDDITAAGISIMENRHRKGIPGWRYALKIGEMYGMLNHNGNKSEIVKIIMEKTGLSNTSIAEYLDISDLPDEIIDLMKRPEERSEIVRELEKRFLLEEGKILDIRKAAMISRALGSKGYSLERIFEVAVVAMTHVSRDRMKDFLEAVRVYPNLRADEVYSSKVLTIPEAWRASIIFEATMSRAIYEACILKQMNKTELVRHYVSNGLKADGVY